MNISWLVGMLVLGQLEPINPPPTALEMQPPTVAVPVQAVTLPEMASPAVQDGALQQSGFGVRTSSQATGDDTPQIETITVQGAEAPKKAPAAPVKPADPTGPKNRGLPSPFYSLPFPSSEFQGLPLVGVPDTSPRYALMQYLQGNWIGDWFDTNRIKMFGWLDLGANLSTSKNTNFPVAYANIPNSLQLDQAILRFERVEDTVQTDHIDWGFRFTNLYGLDYRYTTALGYFSDQLLKHNNLYGWDPLEIYGELYVPGVADGMVLRLGRYISPPDIEAQLAPDNFLYTHSLLYAYDAYTHTGLLDTVKLNKYWTVQAGVYSGNDMAPWSKGAIPTGYGGVRWVSEDNHDSVFTVLNSINNGQFRSGHDNLQYVVSTWTHKFDDRFFTTTEAYYMWQRDANKGGSFNNGPFKDSVDGGGGAGAPIPGVAPVWGILNYTLFMITQYDYICVRNEYWDDTKGERTGFATLYTTHTIGWCHHFNDHVQIRPEIDYDRAYQVPAFNDGTRKNQVVAAMDVIIRF